MNRLHAPFVIALLVALAPAASASDADRAYMRAGETVSNDLSRAIGTESRQRRRLRIKASYRENQGFVFRINIRHLLTNERVADNANSEAYQQSMAMRSKLGAQLDNLRTEVRLAVGAARKASGDADRKTAELKVAELEGKLGEVQKAWIAASRKLVAVVRKSRNKRKKALGRVRQAEKTKILHATFSSLCESGAALHHAPPGERVLVVFDGAPGSRHHHHLAYEMKLQDVTHCHGGAATLIDSATSYEYRSLAKAGQKRHVSGRGSRAWTEAL